MPVDVLVPPVGTNVDTLILVTWHRQEGETVTKDEPLFSVETDKALLEIEAPATGILRQVAFPEGSEVTALSRIAVIVTPGEAFTETEATGSPSPGVSAFVATEATSPPLSQPSTHPIQKTPARRFISPRARRLAEENRIEWSSLHGTGPEGAIIERDIQQALAARANVPASETTAVAADADIVETIPIAGVRAVIFERMARSSVETAPVTLTTETDADALVELRRRLRSDGVNASYNDLLLAILARALREHPRMNASLESSSVRVWRRIHIGLAVDTERGLLVPVIRNVDQKGLEEIAQETAEKAEAARQGRLAPEEMRRGTFTLTNLGMFGIDAFTPVINLPECAILGVGRIKPQPAVVEDQIVIQQRMWLSLTFDHRLVDGGPAARFLQRIAQLIEKPHLLLT
jgi:pyruvate dehydrogenase E2 component (dihydrolipoamide acetyltransferase)